MVTGEDSSWEQERDELGGIRSGAVITLSGNPLNDKQKTPLKSTTVVPPSSATKTPRQKKMPEVVAALHRLAIPYLKELDSRIFGDRLGASYLPDLDSPPPPGQKQRDRKLQGVIWGMSTRGEYNDGKGSYIELAWSNRMATTAGKTEYKKFVAIDFFVLRQTYESRTAQGQITMKIELGVKVITDEGTIVQAFPYLSLTS